MKTVDDKFYIDEYAEPWQSSDELSVGEQLVVLASDWCGHWLITDRNKGYYVGRGMLPSEPFGFFLIEKVTDAKPRVANARWKIIASPLKEVENER